MFSRDFDLWDRRLGWMVFFIALITYALTVEPTGSFWDAGEYIATAAKLQIGHPPGAPLLQMIGAFFAMFALEPTQIARMVNYVSGVSSAFTILFMFWTITNLLRKLVGKTTELSSSQAIAVLGSGIVGSLAFAYSDSFWFNAVETEVYGMASFIMALLLWLGLKWTDNLDTDRGDKWLVLISFIVGLTFGIQFMGFLAIPSIGLLYYFKKYKTTTVKNTTSLLVRQKEDMIGRAKFETLKERFEIDRITGIKRGVIWNLTVNGGNFETVLNEILNTHILFNPLSHECYRIN